MMGSQTESLTVARRCCMLAAIPGLLLVVVLRKAMEEHGALRHRRQLRPEHGDV